MTKVTKVTKIEGEVIDSWKCNKCGKTYYSHIKAILCCNEYEEGKA